MTEARPFTEQRVIEGCDYDDDRTTVTIPTGSIGNNQPIEIVEERWKIT
ncbi:MAG: hypothetical protein U0X75_30130 [Acidobacteriota bacterium]